MLAFPGAPPDIGCTWVHYSFSTTFGSRRVRASVCVRIPRSRSRDMHLRRARCMRGLRSYGYTPGLFSRSFPTASLSVTPPTDSACSLSLPSRVTPPLVRSSVRPPPSLAAREIRRLGPRSLPTPRCRLIYHPLLPSLSFPPPPGPRPAPPPAGMIRPSQSRGEANTRTRVHACGSR